MHLFTAISTRHHLHLSLSPIANRDMCQPVHGRKQCTVPPEKTFFCKGFRIMMHCIEHHVDNTFNISVGCWQALVFNAQLPCHRRAHFIGVQCNPFYLRRCDDICRHCIKHHGTLYIEAKRLCHSQQSPLLVPYLQQQLTDLMLIPHKMRPFFILPDIHILLLTIVLCGQNAHYSPQIMRQIYTFFSAWQNKCKKKVQFLVAPLWVEYGPPPHLTTRLIHCCGFGWRMKWGISKGISIEYSMRPPKVPSSLYQGVW